MAYWLRCDRVVIDGSNIQEADDCPCPSYVIAVKCRRDENENPDCSCEPEDHIPNVFIGRYMICNRQPFVLYDDEWYPLAEIYSPSIIGDEHWVFRLLEGPENLQKITRIFNSQDPEYWGEKARDICQCCCIFSSDSRITFSMEQSYSWREEDYTWLESYKLTGNALVRTRVPGWGELDVPLVQVEEYTLTKTDGDNTCTDEIAPPLGSAGFFFRISEDCKELILESIQCPAVYADPEGCYHGGYFIALMRMYGSPDAPRSSFDVPYIEGSWSFDFSEEGDYYSNSLKGSVEIYRVSPATPSSSYQHVYQELNEQLQ